MPYWLKFILYCFATYLLGSINFARLMAGFKKATIPQGANPGAATVFIKIGKKLGVITALLDASKAMVPIFIAKWYFKNIVFSQPIFLCLIGLAAVIGHCYSFYYNFQGGWGLATSAGVIFSLFPIHVLWVFPLYSFLVFYYKENLSLAALVCLALLFIIIILSRGWSEFYRFLPGISLVLLFMLFRNFDRGKDLKERIIFLLNKK